VECLFEFVYFGLQITSDGKLYTEIEKQVAAAWRATPCCVSTQDSTERLIRHVYSEYYCMEESVGHHISDIWFV